MSNINGRESSPSILATKGIQELILKTFDISSLDKILVLQVNAWISKRKERIETLKATLLDINISKLQGDVNFLSPLFMIQIKCNQLIMNSVIFQELILEQYSLFYSVTQNFTQFNQLLINQVSSNSSLPLLQLSSGTSITIESSIFSLLQVSNQELCNSNIENQECNLDIYSQLASSASPYTWGIILISDSPLVTISKVKFENNFNHYSFSGGIAFNQIQLALITGSNFISNSVIYFSGGALAAYSSIIKIDNSTFFNNTALKERGGAVFLRNSSLLVFNSTFEENSAIIGGAVSYFPADSTLQIGESSSFISNKGKSLFFESYSNYFTNQGQFYGENIGTLPALISGIDVQQIPLNFSHSIPQYSLYDKLTMKNFISGFSNTQKMYLSFLDENYFPLRFDLIQDDQQISKSVKKERDTYILEVIVPENNNDIFFLEGQALLYNVSINCFELSIKASFSQQYFHQLSIQTLQPIGKEQKTLNLPFDLEFRDCIIGEIRTIRFNHFMQIIKKAFKYLFALTFRCEKCLEGSYSFKNPVQNENTICINCPSSANYCQGDQMQLKDSYWRSSLLSDNIFECSSDGCSEASGNQNRCRKGYLGPLCSSCDSKGDMWGQKYGKANEECKQCADSLIQQITLCISIFFMVLYLCINLKLLLAKRIDQIKLGVLRHLKILFISSLYYNRDSSGMLLKIIMSYLQILSSSISFWVFIPNFLLTIINLGGSPSSLTSLSYDCFILKSNYYPLFFHRIVMQLLQIMIAIYFSIKVQQNFLKSQNYRKKNCYILGIVIVYLFYQPSFSNFLIKSMICQKIEDSWYLTSDLNQQCFTSIHLFYSISFVYPLSLLWILIIPIILFIKTKKFMKSRGLLSINYLFSYEIIIRGYSQKCFFWEGIKMIKKLAFSSVICLDVNFELKCQILAVITILYIIALKIIHPIHNITYQRFEQLLMTAISSTLLLIGLATYLEDDEFFSNAIKIISLAINFLSFSYVLLVYLLQKKQETGFFQNKWILKLIEKFPKISNYIKIKQVKVLRTSQLWSKIQKNLQTIIKNNASFDISSFQFSSSAKNGSFLKSQKLRHSTQKLSQKSTTVNFFQI